MVSKLFLYEAGALTYHYKNNTFNLALNWRDKLDKFASDNNIETFNPAKTYLIERNHTYNPIIAVHQNKWYLDKSDILILDMNYIDYSPGTQWECVYASQVKIIPIIAFGKKHWSPHIMSGISHLCKDIDEVIEVLINMFGQSFS